MASHEELLAEAIEALERVGCEFEYCGGPTLEPEDMRTCYVCDLLARLRVALGRPPRLPDELSPAELRARRFQEDMDRATGRTRP